MARKPQTSQSEPALSPAETPVTTAPKVTTIYRDENEAMIDILDNASDMPGVSPGISDLIEQTKNDPPPTPFSNSQIVDGFDPAIHESDELGRPIKNIDGSLRRKRGRKSGVNYTSAGSAQIEPVDADQMKRKAAAQAATALLVGTTTAVFGTEWMPIADKKTGIDERANLAAAFESYFEVAGTVDLPPSLALCVAVAAYAVPRFSMPQTQEKARGLFGWFRAKIDERKERKAMRLAA